jgi:hypothetical protein
MTMMNPEEAVQNLEFIKNMMAQTKHDVMEKNIGQMIAWGVLVSLSCYLLASLDGGQRQHWDTTVWIGCFTLGLVYSAFDSHKHLQKVKVLNTLSRIFATLWFASYAVFVLAIFLPLLAGDAALELSGVSLISFVLAINYTVMSVALRIAPLKLSAFSFFLCSILLYFVPQDAYYLLFGTAMLIGQVIPSIWMKFKA